MGKIKKYYATERNKLGRMLAIALVILCSIAAPLPLHAEVTQPTTTVGAPLGSRTFVASITLPANVVRVDAVTGLTHAANWFDAPAHWEWVRTYDQTGYVTSVSVYVTLDANNTTTANGQTVCCWTMAEAILIATDSVGMQYNYPFQVLAQ